MAKIKQVRKSDGTLVPFRERKIYDALMLALRASGTEDPLLAEDLCGAVVHFVEKRSGEDPPSSRDIEALVLRVLRETGHTEAAVQHEVIQARRKDLEADLLIVASLRPTGEEFAFEVEPSAERWKRDVMEAELEASGLVPAGLADEVVTAVEAVLINGGLRVVSRRLLAELRDSELVRRGFSPLEPADDRIEVHRRDIEGVLERPAAGRSLLGEVAGQVFAPWARRFVHGGLSARLHDEGRLHLHGLQDPFRVERIVLPVGLALPAWDGQPGVPYEALLWLQGLSARLEPHVRAEIVLPDLVLELAERGRHADPDLLARATGRALDRRDAFGRARRPLIRLCAPLCTPAGAEHARGFLAALIRLFGGEDRPRGVALDFVHDEALVALPDAMVRTAIEVARRLPEARVGIQRIGDPALVPTDASAHALRLGVARVAVNLPLVLLDHRTDAFERVLEDVRSFGAKVRTALAETYWSLRRMPEGGLRALLSALSAGHEVLVPAEGQEVDVEVWGLGHALSILVARKALAPARRPEATAKLLEALDESVGAKGEDGVSFRVLLGGATERPVRARMLSALSRWCDQAGLQDVIKVLSKAPGERVHELTLPMALPLFGGGNQALLGARIASRFGPGLALPYPAFESEAPDGLLGRLARETTLGRLSFESLGGERQTFEVQEELFS